MASTLQEQGLDKDVKTAKEVRSLDGYDAVVLGTPLSMAALHKGVCALLEKNRAALAHTPFALFALGPIKADDGVDGSRVQLSDALAKPRLPTPVSTAAFLVAYDPARLGFKDKMIAAPPASQLHGEPACDERDWEAIATWARGLAGPLTVAPSPAGRVAGSSGA